jgi:hypothetical protein
MQQVWHWKVIWGVVALALLISLAGADAGTPSTASPAAAKLARLRIAIAPLGWDTNYTWLQSRSAFPSWLRRGRCPRTANAGPSPCARA